VASQRLTVSVLLLTAALLRPVHAEWVDVYRQSFDKLPVGTLTGSKLLPEWQRGSASGTVFDGKTKVAKRFLVAQHSWSSFNQGPIFKLDLSATPHDRVRVSFDLYTFGDWRGLQRKTGGPLHRLMFFDNHAKPGFAFDTNFATNTAFQQSWPDRNPAAYPAGKGAQPFEADATGRFGNGHRWPVSFEYPSATPSLRFTILCGAAAGSGQPMPPFGVDNVRVSVRSTAPVIVPTDCPDEVRLAVGQPRTDSDIAINFAIENPGRVSLGIFERKSDRLIRTLLSGDRLQAGKHSIAWDGLDHRGRPVAAGQYEWRLLTSPGLTARYITTIGINPPGGENPSPRYSWVGDHMGAGTVDVDETGVYVGPPITEGMMMLVKVAADRSKVEWTRPQFYQGGRLTKVATSGQQVFMLHPTGRLRRLNCDTGHVEAEWDVNRDGVAPGDLDADGHNLVLVDPQQSFVRWLSPNNGQSLSESKLPGVTGVATISSDEGGAIIAATDRKLFRLAAQSPPQQVAELDGTITAVDFDSPRSELWAVLDGHKVVRLDSQFNIAQVYSEQPREFGPFDPTRFTGVFDIAADHQGGFLIAEPGHAPRRVAHVNRDGSIRDQWFGGMSFYIGGSFDPADPSLLYGIAPEGSVNVYRIDFDTGSWKIEETYATGRLGDSLFPNAGSFRAIRRNGQTFLYHRVVPAVLKLDPKLRRAVPVAIAGRVINRGRTFFQFAGTGHDGYPRPWVAAAKHHGFGDLKKAPPLYSWADSDGDGEFDPEEFQFYADAQYSLSFHNPGDFKSNGDYVGTAGINKPHALVQLPVSGWEGPEDNAPRWDFSKASAAGQIIAESYGYGSPRCVSVGPNDSVSVAYQAGIMIREHGQYEGGGWPETSQKGSRILRFDAKLAPTSAVGRQSKDGSEANSGVLFYPMQTSFGPNRSVIVNDQTKQPAQVWSHDGLYVGGFFDQRADDGLPDGFYQIHGNDNQGATVVTANNGRTYWLMPYVGHNRLYEISGWDNWQRQSGQIALPSGEATPSPRGTGLTASYYQGQKLALETVEAPIYHEPFGAEPHADRIKPHYKAIWTGFVDPPFTDRYRFTSLLGSNEQLAVWIDGRLVHSAGLPETASHSVEMTGDHRHRIRIEYINPDGRAELKLLWSSRSLDPTRISTDRLYPDASR